MIPQIIVQGHTGRRLAVVACLLLLPLFLGSGSSGQSKSSSTSQPAKQAPAPAPAAGASHAGQTGGAAARPAIGGPHGGPEAGSRTVRGADGTVRSLDASGRVTSIQHKGINATFGKDGRATLVQDTHRGLTVTRSAHGSRTVVSQLPAGAVVVSSGKNHGYVFRVLRPGYVQRTTIIGQRRFVGVYRESKYRGLLFHTYVPPVYYQPKFYAWAATPWAAPVAATWAWRGAPWFGASAGYFVPAAYYPSASFWLADYVMAADLSNAYQVQQEDAAGAPPAAPAADAAATPVSPAVRAAIADAVMQQIAEDRAAAAQSASQAASGPPAALDPAQRVFVVSSDLDVRNQSGAACTLSAGDVIIRLNEQVDTEKRVTVNVLSSKANDCPANTSTLVRVDSLQEMHNNFRQQVGSGLDKLANSHGTGGLPAAPPAGAFRSPDGQGQADLNAERALITQQQQAADASEAEAVAAAGSGG